MQADYAYTYVIALKDAESVVISQHRFDSLVTPTTKLTISAVLGEHNSKGL